MTYVEFFDTIAAENICACLTYVPDRVIYIGSSEKLMLKHIKYYSRVFNDRGYNIKFIPKTVITGDLENAVSVLSDIVETYDDCVFDITGGDEFGILALGVVFAKYPEKNIQIHKLNLKNNAIYDYDMDNNTIFRDIPTLSVEENIRIYGGDIVYGDVSEENTYKWDLNDDFINDVDLIWDICKKDVRFWNISIGVFDVASKVGKSSDDGLTVTASVVATTNYLKSIKAKYDLSDRIIASLLHYGLLTNFSDDGKTLTISFKNAQIKRCLTKAGQALELKTFILAKGILDKQGGFAYDDAMNGVVIDWDGEFHDEETEDIYDTENEIDVLLMHDVIPIFISCKNGNFDANELYKLDTVAKRFGGPYAKKILVSTAFDQNTEKGKYLLQRMKDMNIILINLEDVQNLSDKDFALKLKNLWNAQNK